MVHSRAPATLGVTVAVLATSFLFVFFRFVSRGWVVRKLAIDDWLILLAWLFAFGLSFSICYGTKVGLGRHHQDVHQSWHVPLQKSEYAFSVFYNPALMSTKTSIIVFFLSFSKEEKIFRWCNYLTLFVVNAAGLALTIVSIAQCRPLSAAFQYPIPSSGKCIDIVALYLASAPVNIITDLALLFLPMPILTQMRLPKKQKIILIVTFGFGIFVAVVDVVRIAYLEVAAVARVEDAETSSAGQLRVREQSDFSWYASLSYMWSAVEVNLGIICACVPALKPLFLRFLPSWIKDSQIQTEKFPSNGSDHQDSPVAPETVDSLRNPAAAVRPMSTGTPRPDSTAEMDFFEFLSGAADDASPITQVATNATWTTTTSRTSPTFFDFVKMRKPKNMLRLSNRECFMPVLVVTVLFFMWGFAYGFLNILNQQFQTVVQLSGPQSMGLHAAYFGGYFVGPLTLGRWVLKRFGFKATMITGLIVYACGTLIFWPSAVLTSYAAYIFSNLIVGAGLSILEVASNPFIILCGPLEYAEIRLNVSQGIQAIGTVVSPLLAKKVLFRSVHNAPALIDVQWTYLAIAVFDILLALALYYIHLPEASDEDLDELADRRSAVYNAKVANRFPVVWVTFALGVFSQFCYVGGQENIGVATQSLVDAIFPVKKGRLDAFDYQTVGHAIFAFGRFTCAFLNYFTKPRWILLGLYIGLIVTTALMMALPGEASIAMVLLAYFFESGVFSIIFAISLRGLGVHTKTACALMTTAISGGAPFPPIQSAVATGHGIRYSFCVNVATFAFGAIFPIYLNLVPQAKAQVDPVHDARLARRGRRGARGRNASTTSADPNGKLHAFGLPGILERRRQSKQWHQEVHEKHDEGQAKHVERGSDSGPSSFKSEVPVQASTWDFAFDDVDPMGEGSLEVLGHGQLDGSDLGPIEKGRERQFESIYSEKDEAVQPSMKTTSNDEPEELEVLGQGPFGDIETRKLEKGRERQEQTS